MRRYFMNNNEKSKNNHENKTNPQKKKDGHNFGGWLFKVEGTVAEPWTSAKELLEDKKLQEKVKQVREIVQTSRNSKKSD